jgi:hypothetical protein
MSRYALGTPASRERSVSDVHLVTPFSISLRDTVRMTAAGWDALAGEKLRGRRRVADALSAFRNRKGSP